MGHRSYRKITRSATLQGEKLRRVKFWLKRKPCTMCAELSSKLDETLPLKVRKKRCGENCSPRHGAFGLPKLSNPSPGSRRLMKTLSRPTLSPRERAGFSMELRPLFRSDGELTLKGK